MFVRQSFIILGLCFVIWIERQNLITISGYIQCRWTKIEKYDNTNHVTDKANAVYEG